jgi:hypothetical protein
MPQLRTQFQFEQHELNSRQISGDDYLECPQVPSTTSRQQEKVIHYILSEHEGVRLLWEFRNKPIQLELNDPRKEEHIQHAKHLQGRRLRSTFRTIRGKIQGPGWHQTKITRAIPVMVRRQHHNSHPKVHEDGIPPPRMDYGDRYSVT